jgi:hypothetical protein
MNVLEWKPINPCSSCEIKVDKTECQCPESISYHDGIYYQKKLLEFLIVDCKRMIEFGDAITDVAKSIYQIQVDYFKSMLKQLDAINDRK